MFHFFKMNQLNRADLILSLNKNKYDKEVLKYFEKNINYIAGSMYVKIIHIKKDNYKKLRDMGIKNTPTLVYNGNLYEGAASIIKIWKKQMDKSDVIQQPLRNNNNKPRTFEEMIETEKKKNLKDDEEDVKFGDGFNFEEVQKRTIEAAKKYSANKQPNNIPNNNYFDEDNEEEELNNYLTNEIMK
jgi:hypothetical protein